MRKIILVAGLVIVAGAVSLSATGLIKKFQQELVDRQIIELVEKNPFAIFSDPETGRELERLVSKALEIDPQNPNYVQWMVSIRVHKGDLVGARDALRAGFKPDSTSAYSLFLCMFDERLDGLSDKVSQCYQQSVVKAFREKEQREASPRMQGLTPREAAYARLADLTYVEALLMAKDPAGSAEAQSLLDLAGELGMDSEEYRQLLAEPFDRQAWLDIRLGKVE